jgi:hypothetical protein
LLNILADDENAVTPFGYTPNSDLGFRRHAPVAQELACKSSTTPVMSFEQTEVTALPQVEVTVTGKTLKL